MSGDYKVFKNTTLADLFEKIDTNSKRNKIQIESLIQELMTFIKDPNSAIQLFPMISDYMEANIRNDVEGIVDMRDALKKVREKSDITINENYKGETSQRRYK